VNIFLPNGNRYGEINPRMNNMLLQAVSLHFFNLSPILKPYTTKKKYLATLSNTEQVMATLKTITNLQFPQRVYPALIERNYKYMSTSSTPAPNMRTTTKFSAISQALYIY